MAASAEREMNLAAMRQRDPYISGIVDTASQVALYTFSPKENEWEKTEVEGTLFVYTRSADPVNGFMILNRLGLHDLIEPINKNLEFQLQDPFLLYKNAKCLIHGIWFYDKDECARIGQLMNSLVQVTIDSKDAQSSPIARQRRASESDTMIEQRTMRSNTGASQSHAAATMGATNVDIMQMLCKAQDEYDKSKQPSPKKMSTHKKAPVIVKGNGSVAPPKPMIDNPNASATKSGGNLIRPLALKASQSPVEEVGAAKPETPTTQISLETLFRKASIQHTQPESSKSTTNASGSSLMQRLKSNPGTTLEEIERQQNLGPTSAHPPLLPQPQTTKAAYTEPDSPNTAIKRSLNMIPTAQVQVQPSPSKPAQPPLNSLFIPPPQQTPAAQPLVTPLALLQPSSLLPTQPPQPPSEGILLAPNAFEGGASVRMLTPPSTSLPFSSSAKSFSPHCITPEQSTQNDSQAVNPLTKDQLQQAMIHLLKNDSAFLSTLHEAYVKSLNFNINPRSDNS